MSPLLGALNRELTPAEHASIRRQLFLIPAYLWFVVGWFLFFQQLPLGLPGSKPQIMRDFVHFYVQGMAANEHNAHALYDIDALAAMVPRAVPGSHEALYPPVYGPQVSLLFSPLARLPYLTALYVWMVLSVLVYGACGYVIWTACPRLKDSGWLVVLLLLASPAFQFELGPAQASPIGLVCVTAAFLALRANRPLLAGIAIGSLAYKPPLGIAAAVVFLAAREWRIVLGAIVAAVVQIGVGCWYWGLSILRPYAEALLRLPDLASGMEPTKFHMHSWRAFFDLLGLPAAVALPAYIAMSVLTLVVATRCWQARGPLVLRYAALMIATVLVDPHMYVYDFILLTPAFLLLWDWSIARQEQSVAAEFPAASGSLGRRPFALMFQLLLYACVFSPGFAVVAIIARIQPSVLALAMLGLVVAGLLMRATGCTREGMRPIESTM